MKRVTFYEEKKELLLSTRAGSPFKFNLRSESEKLNVAPYCLASLVVSISG